MRMPSLTLICLLSANLAAPSYAQTPEPFTKKNGVITSNQFVATPKGGEEVTCQDFLTLADEYKPQAVSYVIGLNKGRNPKLKVVDVTAVNKLVPAVASTCRSRKHDALRDTVSTVLYHR